MDAAARWFMLHNSTLISRADTVIRTYLCYTNYFVLWVLKSLFIFTTSFALYLYSLYKIPSLFQAPYLPWVLLGFSLLLGNSVSVDLLGMAVGHIYYFLEDVFPNQHGGMKLIQTPMILKVWSKKRSNNNTNIINLLFKVLITQSILECGLITSPFCFCRCCVIQRRKTRATTLSPKTDPVDSSGVGPMGRKEGLTETKFKGKITIVMNTKIEQSAKYWTLKRSLDEMSFLMVCPWVSWTR